MLQALAESFQLTESWDADEKVVYLHKMLSYLGVSSPKGEEAEPAKGKKGCSFWQFLTKKYRGRVRSACLIFATQLLNVAPAEVAAEHIEELAPLVFDMVAEDNSLIQATLWRDALFTIGKQYPQAWSLVSLKKAFIPNMLACVKNAGYGASTALYQNLTKFVSVFPLFSLVDFADDKLNKFGLKDRAKFLVQFYQHLFAGLKNDEATSYHSGLVGAYFETLSFFILKRYQPLVAAQAEDLEFVHNQLRIVLELPLNDFLNKYEKSKNEAFEKRNTRELIPANYCRMFKNLGDRDLEAATLQFVTDVVYENLCDRL